MEKIRISSIKGFAIALAFASTACSQVHFDDVTLSKANSASTQAPQQETFNFNDSDASSKVDILIVDDNSGSMLERQQKMAARLGPFIDTLENVDWQIGITTTDTSSGFYGQKGAFVDLVGASGKILSKNTRNYETVFKNTIVRSEIFSCTAPFCPTDDERPLQAIVHAIEKRNSDNTGFFRAGAALAAVVLSDEDEIYAKDGQPTQPSAVIEAVKAAFGANKAFTTYGIITKPDDEACITANMPLISNLRHPSVLISQLIQATGGVAGSVCDTDYISSLTAIGKKVLSQVGSRTLMFLPIPDSVQVVVSPFDPDLSYWLEGRQLKFNKMPKQGTTVVVRYVASSP